MTKVRQDDIQMSVLRSESELDLLESEWNGLLDESEGTVFQSFEWIRTWWKHFGEGRELFCLIVRHHNDLIGIVPLYKDVVSILGIRIAKRLQFIGRPLSDYLDIISKTGFEEIVLKCFADYLHSINKGWDVLDFEEIPEHSSTMKFLVPFLQEYNMNVYRLPGPPCPIIHLPKSFEEFLHILGPSTRAGYRRKLKHFHEEFSVKHETRRLPNENIREGVEKFVKIHERRWKGLGFPSAFDDPNHTKFHVAVAEKFAERDWLRLFLIEANQETIAASLEFNYKNRIYMYQSNATASYHAMRYSPGLLIKMDAIEQGIKEGMCVYDLLRGDEHYKYDNLKAVTTTNSMLRISGNTFSKKFRFGLYLIYILSTKMFGRTVLEWHEFKRFRITKKPHLVGMIAYSFVRLNHLTKLGISFIEDHLRQKQKSQ